MQRKKGEREGAEEVQERRRRGDERSQCQCLGSDSSLFKGPSETCTGCPSTGAVSMQSDALSVCLCLFLTHTVSLSQWLVEE